MKLLFVALLLGFSAMAYAKEMITLEFETIASKNAWVVWYLDGGGEDHSRFTVESWDWDTMRLERDFIDIEKERQSSCNKKEVEHRYR